MINTLIGLYARLQDVDRAFLLYQQLIDSPRGSGLDPDIFTYSNLLNALAKVRPQAAEACGIYCAVAHCSALCCTAEAWSSVMGCFALLTGKLRLEVGLKRRTGLRRKCSSVLGLCSPAVG